MERPQLKGTTRHSKLLLSRRGWSVVLVITSLFASQVTAQTIEILHGDNVIAEGIPKIPASLKASVDRYRTFYSSSLLGWDPVQRSVIIQVSTELSASSTGPGARPISNLLNQASHRHQAHLLSPGWKVFPLQEGC